MPCQSANAKEDWSVSYVATSSIVKSGEVSHEVETITGTGNIITVCQRLISPSKRADDIPSGVVDIDGGEVTCEACHATHLPPPPPPDPLLSPPRRVQRRPPSGRPQWRVSKSAAQNAGENLKYALVAIVASAEWHNRGIEGQFRENMLDQAALAYRFLGELLVSHGRDTNPVDPDDL